MTARRVVALLVAATSAAILTSTLARAATSPRSATQPGQASLVVRPGSGDAGSQFDAFYAYSAGGGACPPGQVILSWDGQPFTQKSIGTRSCTATFRGLTPPDAAASPGDHTLSAVLSASHGTVDGSEASTAYTITAADPTQAPTVAPPTQAPPPPPTAAPPAPVATAPPPPSINPTPLPVAAAGSFPAYACRNGIPDSTPCPTPSGAVAALTVVPAAPPATPPPTDSSSAPPWRLIAGGSAGAAVLLLCAIALGWRQGAGKRRRSFASAALAAPAAPKERGRGAMLFAALLPRRRGRRVPGGNLPPLPEFDDAPARPRAHRAPPPPSAPPRSRG